MTTERKTIRAEIKQAGDDGTFEAVVATLGVVDSDGDIVERGALAGQTVHILPAHDAFHVPLGKARYDERGDEVWALGRFNLEIASAADWHKAIKFDLEHPPSIQEWSWDYIPKRAEPDTIDGQSVRRLIALDSKEVSPVLRGASVNTRTVSAKARKGKLIHQVRAVTEDAAAAVERIREVSAMRAKDGRELGAEMKAEALKMAAEIESLAAQVEALAAHVAPEDEVAQALAVYTVAQAQRALR